MKYLLKNLSVAANPHAKFMRRRHDDYLHITGKLLANYTYGSDL